MGAPFAVTPRHARSAQRRERRIPVRAWPMAEWALLPLRLFLGVTFAFAGLQKLANPNFFHAQSPISIQAQIIAASHTSPIRGLLVHLVGYATPIGLVIAFAEVAIGIGVLVGLWTRIVAIGGAILSLSLFLTVSFHTSPYFTGADIVFLFAWMPFIIAGGGTGLSADGWIGTRVAKQSGVSSPELVAIPFATVQRLCGQFREGRCAAREGLACDQAACPVLLGSRAPLATRVSIDSVDRRSVVVGGMAAAERRRGGAAPRRRGRRSRQVARPSEESEGRHHSVLPFDHDHAALGFAHHRAVVE